MRAFGPFAFLWSFCAFINLLSLLIGEQPIAMRRRV